MVIGSMHETGIQVEITYDAGLLINSSWIATVSWVPSVVEAQLMR